MKTKTSVLTEEQRYKRLANRDKLEAGALAYVRVSTDDQELGVEAQLAELKKWAIANSLIFNKIYIDKDISGKTDPAQRPALRDLLRHVEVNEIDYVVVFRLDRLSRDVSINGFVEFVLRRHGCRLLTCSQDPATPVSAEDQLMRTVVAGMAEYERALISLRTKGALAAARARGVRLGRRKRLSYKENCKLYYVIRYLDEHGCTIDYIKGYLANHCQTVLTDSTISRYNREDGIPFFFPIREVCNVLKAFYRQRNGKPRSRTATEEQKIKWMPSA